MRKITTYERFHRHVAAWADNEIDTLLVLGPAGYGKSTSYRQALGDRPYHLLGQRQTPIEVYNTLYDAPHLPAVLDDNSGLLRDNNFIDLLKGLCETGRKQIRWGTTTRLLEHREKSFVYTSHALIVLNQIPRDTPDVSAVLDRCDAIEFAPTKAEVIARMKEVFPDDGDLIDLFVELPTLPTLRTMKQAQKWKRSKHLNLIEELLSECGVPKPVVTLIGIMETLPEAEWWPAYSTATGMTDRSFRRHRQIAEEILACRASGDGCPSVRLGGADNDSPKRTGGHAPPDAALPAA